jgi:hypothetical protein
MAHLGAGRPDLCPLNATALLDAPMVALDGPGLLFQLLMLAQTLSRSLVAQFSASPFGEMVRNTLMNP